MKMVREVGETFPSASGPDSRLAPLGLRPLAARICYQKYQLELLAEEARLNGSRTKH